MANVLVLGNGGREDAIAWKLEESPNVANIFVYPGNAGTLVAGGKICKGGKTAKIKSTSTFLCLRQQELSLDDTQAFYLTLATAETLWFFKLFLALVCS